MRRQIGYLLAVLVRLASLAIVYVYSRNARERELRAAEAAFVAETDSVADLIRQRLQYYDLVLHSGVSLFATVERPTREQWRAFYRGFDIETQFPAAVGLGFAAYVPGNRLTTFQMTMRDAGLGYVSIRPAGARPDYGPILLLEPASAENLAATGFDMLSEARRRESMLQALDTGRTPLSSEVYLVQDGGRPVPALILSAPVYQGHALLGSNGARRQAGAGWVYIPLRLAPMVQKSLEPMPKRPSFRLVDVDAAGEHVLYAESPARALAPAFTRDKLLEAYGRHWKLEFASPPLVEVEAGLRNARASLMTGLLGSLLLFGIALALVRRGLRAQGMAEQMAGSLERSEQRFRSAMQYSAIGKALLDHEGRIVDANPALARLLGRSREELVGSMLDANFVADGGGGREERVADDAYRVTRRLRRSDGDIRQAQLTFASVPGAADSDFVRLVQVEDVTDRLRSEARIRALNRTLEERVALRTRELTQANRELESFAYSISHDLRAPLRSIDGFSRLLGERYSGSIDAAGQDYLARVREAARRMGDLIDAMLKLSRLGRAELNAVPLDLSRIAREVVNDLRLAEPGREVDIRIADGMQAVGDEALVRNLLENLLGNAWKFTRDREAARIDFRSAGAAPAGFAAFEVRDNGAGFPPEYADKLFRPFQRLHTQDEFSGHGIGLVSVKRIVERHGGGIEAEGRPGQGASFRFTLPVDGEAIDAEEE